MNCDRRVSPHRRRLLKALRTATQSITRITFMRLPFTDLYVAAISPSREIQCFPAWQSILFA